MRFSALLSAAVLSFLFLLPQQGVSQPFSWPSPAASQPMSWPPPASEQLLHKKREAERLASYLSDLQRQYDEAKQRGDKNEYRRLRNELKRIKKAASSARKELEKDEKKIAMEIKYRQFDYLCAMGQNPGSCRKCENGRVVIDDSQKPGSCMKCENGQAVYDNSYLSACKRCLNGKVTVLNGTTCAPSSSCYAYTCQQGRCIGTQIYFPSPDNGQCLAAN